MRRIVAVVLAAGRSSRMGGANKLLATLEGRAVVACAVDALLASPVTQVLVVTGHMRADVERALAGRSVRFVHNPDYALGMSTSLRVGLAAVPDEAAAALIALGDMPLVSAGVVGRLVDAFDPGGGASICRPVHAHRAGHPVLWDRRYFPSLMAVSGDAGGRALLDEYAEEVRLVPEQSAGVLIDVDTVEALQALGGSPPGR